MSRRTRAFLRVEALESKQLLASSAMAAPAVAALVSSTPSNPPERLLHLDGLAQGTYHRNDNNPDVGSIFTFFGSGRFNNLGRTAVTGNIHTVGNISQGNAEGTLFLSDPRGTLTLKLEGPKQNAFSGLPDHFRYKVVGGTGAFRNVDDTGTAALVLIPGKAPKNHPGDPDHGRFILVLISDRNPTV